MNFPKGYNYQLPIDDNCFSFLKSIKKDHEKLQNFFDSAIKDSEFWKEQSPEIKQKIIAIVEKQASSNPNLMKSCVETINSLADERFSQLFEEIENRNICAFFEGNGDFSKLEENLEDIVSLGKYLNSKNSNDQSTINSHVVLNEMLLKKFKPEGLTLLLNGIKKDEITESNLPHLLKIAQTFGAQNLLMDCKNSFAESVKGVDVYNLEMRADGLKVIITDPSLIDWSQLKKYIESFEKTNKIKIDFRPVEDQDFEDFLTEFKDDIYSFKVPQSTKILSQKICELKNLQNLNITCMELTELPPEIGNLTNLQNLYLSNCTALKTLPKEIGGLTNLQMLQISGSKALESIPETISELSKIKYLDLKNCQGLMTLPKGIGALTDLQVLDLGGCVALTSLPEEIKGLISLKNLCLSSCNALKEFPAGIEGLANLEILDLSCCDSVKELPVGIGGLTNLQVLNLSSLKVLTLPKEIGKLINLELLYLEECSELTELPPEIGDLTKLYKLDLYGCNKIEKFTRLKILFQLVGSSHEKMNLFLKQIFKIEGDRVLAKSIIKNLNSLKISNLDFISNLDQEKSDLSVFDVLILFALVSPDKFEDIFALFDKSDQTDEKIVIDRAFLEEFKNDNEEYIKKHCKVDDLETFLLALKLGIVVDNPDILKMALRDYFRSEDKEIQGSLTLTEEIKKFFKTEEGKEILIEFREEIFKNNPLVKGLVEKTFSLKKSPENEKFYPISIERILFYDRHIIDIKCVQEAIRKPDNIKEILAKLDPLLKLLLELQVCYFAQPGVDGGALRRDFIANLFETISKDWGLLGSIPIVEIQDFRLLGSLLKYILTRDEFDKLFTGEVFHDSFFKGMVEFDYEQIASEKLSDPEIETILASGYNENVTSILEFLKWDNFSDSVKNSEHVKTFVNFFMKYGLDLDFDSEIELYDIIGPDAFESSMETLVKLTVINGLLLEDSLIDLIGREEYENGSLESKVNLIKSRKSQIEDWIKRDPDFRLMMLKNNLSKALASNEITLDDKSVELINKSNDELIYGGELRSEKINPILDWIKKPGRLVNLQKDIEQDALKADNAYFKCQIRNLHTLLKSMNFSEAEWASIKGKGWESLKIELEGVFSKEGLIEKIKYVNFETMPNLKEVFENWFNDADEVTLKKFVKFMTGSSSLPNKDIPINLLLEGNKAFDVHSCSGYMDIGAGLTEDEVVERMKYIIVSTGQFDNA